MRILISFLFLFFFFSGFRIYGAENEMPYSNSRYITIDSVRLHFRVWNENYPDAKGKLLFIHGFIGSTYCFRMNVDALAARGYMVVAVDLPCFGYSDRSLTFNQSQEGRGKLLWKLLDSIDHGHSGKWHLCGHSMGGGTAEAMALIEPHRTRSLTIANGMVFLKNVNLETQFTFLAKKKPYRKIMVNLVEKRFISYKSVRKALKKNYRFEPDSTVVMNYYRPLCIDGTAECILNVWAKKDEEVRLKAENLSGIPVLVIWGSKDRTIFLRTGKRFVNHVPHAQLIVIHGAGHAPMETHADVFNSLLLGFLDKNR